MDKEKKRVKLNRSFIALQLENKQVVPPYNPTVENDRDLQHFDTQFTNEVIGSLTKQKEQSKLQ